MKMKTLVKLGSNLLIVSLITACGASDTTAKVNSFTLSSSSYANNTPIPTRNVCSQNNGLNQSPQLSWENAPQGTSKYAIIMDDEVNPCGTGDNACTHWIFLNIPSTIKELNENLDISTISGTVEGGTYNGTADYEGPCPPLKHIYKTTIFALNDSMPILSYIETTRSAFQTTYASHILGTATLVGTFDPAAH